MRNDIKLCYFGGAGGFIILHLILLSKKFFCQFSDDGRTLEQIIDKQWQISNPRLWKVNECWPDNYKTQNAQTDLRKIYFFCNPVINEVNKFNGKIIFLYLDADAHIKMTEYKHAGPFYHFPTSLFTNHVAYYRAQIKEWQIHYDNIKDSSWPKCLSPSGFKKLPDFIQKELHNEPHTSALLNIKKYVALDHKTRSKKIETLYSKKVMAPNGIEVLPAVRDFFPHADHLFKLTDVINDLDLLSEITKTAINQDQIALRDRWKSLHPFSLLNNIGITTDQKPTPHAEQS